MRRVESVQGIGIVGVGHGSEPSARGEDLGIGAGVRGIKFDLEIERIGVEVDGTGHRCVGSESDGEEAAGGGDSGSTSVPGLGPEQCSGGGAVVDFEPHVVAAIGYGDASGARDLALVVDGGVDAGRGVGFG